MPRVEADVHQVYKAQSFQALAIHVGDSISNAIASERSTGLTFPLLVDIDSAVVTNYNRLGEGVALFPLAYLIDKKGVIRQIYKGEEPAMASLKTEIEALIAEPE